MIDTIAGSGDPSLGPPEGGALEINIGLPFGVEIGPDRNLYVTEVQNHRVWRIDPRTGRGEVVAGTGTVGYSGDGGPATEAQLNEPYEVRFDNRGNMYFVEMRNHIVRRVDEGTRRIRTVAGTGEQGFSGDGGPAIEARFSVPHSIALDMMNGLYIADIGNHRIRRVDLRSGIVTTIAGNGTAALPGDLETALDRPIAGPRALFMRRDTLWVALREGHSVWRYDTISGRLRHMAGTGTAGYSGDGAGAARATLNGPKGIALDIEGNIYIADTENNVIRRIERRTSIIETIAGRGPQEPGGDGDGGPALEARLNAPHGICVGPDGTVYVGDTLNHRVRRIYYQP